MIKKKYSYRLIALGMDVLYLGCDAATEADRSKSKYVHNLFLRNAMLSCTEPGRKSEKKMALVIFFFPFADSQSYIM